MINFSIVQKLSLKNNVPFEIIEKDYVIELLLFLKNLLSEINKEEYKRNWNIRLKHQVPDLPAFEIVREELLEKIKEKFIVHNRRFNAMKSGG